MEEQPSGSGPPIDDVGEDTDRFRAFVEADDEHGSGGEGFRLLTLAVGLGVFAVIVVLLLR